MAAQSTRADFRLFCRPQNLQRITPDWLHFEILTPQTTIAEGTLLDYRLRLRGIPLRWQSKVAVWEPPNRFVDRQTRGPYRLWVHEHTFREERGGTAVGDHVEYAAAGGALVRKLLVEPDLQKIFRHRQRVLEGLFSTEQRAAS